MAKARAGDAVVLRAGHYALTNSVSCKADVELRGETGNPHDVVLDAGGQFAVISSVDGGGTVASLTVSNGYAYANSVTGAGIHTGRMVNFSDAKKVISNCVITCCTYAKDPVKGEGNSGAALVLDANSRAIDCLISSCTNSSDVTSGGGGGVILRLNGIGTNVVVRNSLFVGNENLNAEGTAYCAAAYVSEGVSGLTGAVSVENCTFVRNRNRTKSTWALYVGANTAETNCVVALNLNAEGADVVGLGGNGNWQGNWGYSCFYPKLGYSFPETVFNGTAPKFRTGTWVPSAQSPLRDAGLTLGWMADAHDLQRGADGQALCARVVGAAVDIGCFEYAPLGGLLFLIR